MDKEKHEKGKITKKFAHGKLPQAREQNFATYLQRLLQFATDNALKQVKDYFQCIKAVWNAEAQRLSGIKYVPLNKFFLPD